MARNTLGLACSWVSGICISVNASSGELCFVKTVAKKTGVAVAGQFTRMLWEYLVSRENISILIPNFCWEPIPSLGKRL